MNYFLSRRFHYINRSRLPSLFKINSSRAKFSELNATFKQNGFHVISFTNIPHYACLIIRNTTRNISREMVGMFKWQAYKCVAPRVAPTCYIGTAYLRKLRGVSKPLICTSMWKHTPGEWSSDEISRIRNDYVAATLLCVKKKKKKLRDEWNGNFSPEFSQEFSRERRPKIFNERLQ